MFKRAICIGAACIVFVSMLAACSFNFYSGDNAKATQPPTQAPIVVTEAPTEPSIVETTDAFSSGQFKSYTKMSDYLNDPVVHAQYESVLESKKETSSNGNFKEIRWYAADDSTAVFEYTFSQAFSYDQLEQVKQSLTSQESMLKYGAKTSIEEFKTQTSIFNPKAEFKYFDADGNLLYDRVFSESDVEE